MKKVSVLLVLALCLVSLSATSSWAGVLLFDGTLKWREGGTVVIDQTNAPTINTWTVGNPVGSDLIQIFQKDFILNQNDRDVINNSLMAGKTKYTWGVVNDNYSPIYSFHVNAFGYDPILWGTASSSWTMSYHDGYYDFFTTSDPIYGTDREDFWIINNSPGVAFSPASVDLSDGRVADGNGFWVVSGPVPEPNSIVLLGMGLMGIAGSMFRKKFTA